jgi:hypothetical protein
LEGKVERDGVHLVKLASEILPQEIALEIQKEKMV